jgi:pyrimidine operon attenuation protein/uracil phosphoribosyltransferase
MENTRTLILNPEQISWKLQRMAYQIWEQNTDQTELTMIGVAGNGLVVARNLAACLERISPLKIHVLPITINKARPLDELPDITEDLNGKSIVMVDDVANSGKVLLYALRPVLQYLPSRILMCVLVDRKHKAYPVSPDIVGYSLATTLRENINVDASGDTITGVYLE